MYASWLCCCFSKNNFISNVNTIFSITCWILSPINLSKKYLKIQYTNPVCLSNVMFSCETSSSVQRTNPSTHLFLLHGFTPSNEFSRTSSIAQNDRQKLFLDGNSGYEISQTRFWVIISWAPKRNKSPRRQPRCLTADYSLSWRFQ